jgi:hypothetical protein
MLSWIWQQWPLPRLFLEWDCHRCPSLSDYHVEMLRFHHATGNVSLSSQMVSMDLLTDSYAEFFNGILDTQPIAATSSTPLYSNAGYQILGYALEAIAQKPFHEILRERIIEPLSLSRSSHSMPNPTLAVVPSDLTSSQFNLDIGDAIP